MKAAILVDGGFYRRRAQTIHGDVTPAERAVELSAYCAKHLYWHGRRSDLYRIFYYDCPPSTKKIFHPLIKKQIDLEKSDLYKWTLDFYQELKKKRKFALRMGKLADEQAYYTLSHKAVKKFLNGSMTLSNITEQDFSLNMEQKGVDMKIGLDISSMAFKKQVDQIILISGDSDFVSAAKLARREGIDFILDPLGAPIKPDLFEHIDGLRTCDPKYMKNIKSTVASNSH